MTEEAGTATVERRRRVMIDKDMQLYYLTTWVVAGLVIAASLVILRFFATEQISIWDYGPVVLILAFAPAMGIQSILHLHRIAGPAEHVRIGFEKLRALDWDYVMRFRKGDYLKALAEDYNLLADDLRALRRAVLEASEATERALAAAPPGELKAKLEDLRAQMDALAGRVSSGHRAAPRPAAEKSAAAAAEEPVEQAEREG